MTAMKYLTLATMVIGLTSSAIAWDFIITRNSTQKLSKSVYDSIDKFNISDCPNSDNLCTNYSGQRLYDKCQCICSQGKSTFGFYNGKWGCTDNSIIRKHADCTYVLQRVGGSKGERDPLITLPVLGRHNDNNFVDKVPSNNNCTFIAANATFLECDGTWGKVTESRVERKLDFQFRSGLAYVGPYRSSSSADPSLDGRVIRIPIKCNGLTWDPSQCVAFKLKGQLACSSGIISPPFTDEPTKTSPSSTTTANGTGSNNRSEGEDETPSPAVIAGSVVGGLAFVILIAVIIVMISYWKRRKATAKKKSLRHAQDNLAYEQGPDRTMTLTLPLSIRPLPEPPSLMPYEYLESGPSTIQHSNGVIPGSSGQGPDDQCNGEPVYGEIDDTYSRLNHHQLKPARSTNSTINFATNGPAFSLLPDAAAPAPVLLPTPVPASKSSTLKSNNNTGSGMRSFEEYDVVGGQIKSSLPRENTLKPGEPNSLGRVSNGTYDVPGSVIRSSSAERPKSSNEDNTMVPSEIMNQPIHGDTPQREVYETVWDNDDDDDDDDFVARIDLS